MLTTFGEVVLIWIPSALALMLGTFVLLRTLTRMGAERQLAELRAMHPEAFEVFRQTVDYRDYETTHRIDYVKITAHFRVFLERHGMRHPPNPLM